MRKGLYWSQLLLGIGIGLVIIALIWIGIDEFYPDLIQPTIQQTVRPAQERKIVYYEYPYYEFESPTLSLPEVDEGQLKDETLEHNKEQIRSEIDKGGVVNQPDKIETINLEDINIDLPVNNAIASLLKEIKVTEIEPFTREEARTSADVLEFLKGSETDISDNNSESQEDVKSKESSDSTEWIEITVKAGEPAWKIAGHLEDMGILDRSTFLKIVEQMNLDKKLRVGTYRFKKDMNTFEVIAELMKINY